MLSNYVNIYIFKEIMLILECYNHSFIYEVYFLMEKVLYHCNIFNGLP